MSNKRLHYSPCVDSTEEMIISILSGESTVKEVLVLVLAVVWKVKLLYLLNAKSKESSQSSYNHNLSKFFCVL